MNVYEMISFAAAGGYLIPCAVSDLRRRSIPCWLAAGGPLLSAGWMLVRIMTESSDWMEFPTAMIPGAAVLGLSFLTEGQIGTGDGLVLICLGFLLGCRRTLFILFIGLLLSSICSVVLLIRRKAGRKSRIPWMPFLFGGYTAAALWEMFLPPG